MTRLRICSIASALVVATGALAAAMQEDPVAGRAVKTASGWTAQDKTAQDKTAPEQDNRLKIEPAELPVTYPYGPYQVILHARGNYVPVLRWKVEKGILPPGIVLEENGTLHGAAERAGEFRFLVEVRDSGEPQQAVQEAFLIKVVEAMTLEWKVPAHVTANRIDGSVAVSNTTADDLDLTFDVKAVNEYGRATEIGYQHFPLTRGTIGMALPFGETLPHGAYLVYVNLVGEVAKRNLIYRQRMQTPARLHVAVGP